MRHYYRSHLPAAEILAAADEFFPALDLQRTAAQERSRSYAGPLGALTVSVRSEGGHYLFIQVDTDQTGESRLDRNVKRWFVGVHRMADPTHQLQAAY